MDKELEMNIVTVDTAKSVIRKSKRMLKIATSMRKHGIKCVPSKKWRILLNEGERIIFNYKQIEKIGMLLCEAERISESLEMFSGNLLSESAKYQLSLIRGCHQGLLRTPYCSASEGRFVSFVNVTERSSFERNKRG